MRLCVILSVNKIRCKLFSLVCMTTLYIALPAPKSMSMTAGRAGVVDVVWTVVDDRRDGGGMTKRQTTANHRKPPQTTKTTTHHRKPPQTTTRIWDDRCVTRDDAGKPPQITANHCCKPPPEFEKKESNCPFFWLNLAKHAGILPFMQSARFFYLYVSSFLCKQLFYIEKHWHLGNY